VFETVFKYPSILDECCKRVHPQFVCNTDTKMSQQSGHISSTFDSRDILPSSSTESPTRRPESDIADASLVYETRKLSRKLSWNPHVQFKVIPSLSDMDEVIHSAMWWSAYELDNFARAEFSRRCPEDLCLTARETAGAFADRLSGALTIC
jgi:hypothetical protein